MDTMKSDSMTHKKLHLLRLTLIAWLLMIGFDFLLHAGFLAGIYNQPSPFLLPPSTAFALIPVGYLSLFLLTVLQTWLMRRLKLIGWRAGLTFGLGLGGLISGSFNLGLLSSTSASISLLLGWFVGQTLEMAIAGAVIGSGFAGIRLRRLFGIVMIFVLLAVITTIVLQSLGVVPTISTT